MSALRLDPKDARELVRDFIADGAQIGHNSRANIIRRQVNSVSGSHFHDTGLFCQEYITVTIRAGMRAMIVPSGL